MDATATDRHNDTMNRLLRIAGIVLLSMGIIWFLQGINVLPGSFMTGQTRWAVNGAIAMAVGVVLVVVAARRTVGRR